MTLSSRRLLMRGVAPIIGIAALSLSACANSQETSTATKTPFPTVSAVPDQSSAGGEHGSEGHETKAPETSTTAESTAGGKSATLKDKDGKTVGTVSFTQDGSYVKVSVSLEGLPAGWHEMHVHDKGVCTAPDFASAGDHLGAAAGQPTKGYLPTILVLKSGSAEATSETDTFTLDELTAGDGTAVVVHGDASERIACGKVE